jgi:molybdenum cofactor cytidylyltransferase
MPFPAILLSGGASSRMGRPKALLDLGGETFLSHLVRTLSEAGADDVVVVTGAHDEAIRAALEAAPLPTVPTVRVVHNPDHALGQLTSLRAALNVVDHPGVPAVVVALVDHPFVRPSTVRALIEAWQRTRAPVVRPCVRGRHGHPVVFGRETFDALRTVPVEAGARAVVRACGSRVLDVDTDDEGTCLDLDTPEEYTRAIAWWTGKSGDER